MNGFLTRDQVHFFDCQLGAVIINGLVALGALIHPSGPLRGVAGSHVLATLQIPQREGKPVQFAIQSM